MRRVVIQYQGESVEREELDWKVLREEWNEYECSDGTKMKLKTIVGKIIRVDKRNVLWVSNVERSVRFYCDVLGFEVKRQYPGAVFLKIPGSSDDHHLGLFEQTGVSRPDERAARMYHSAWEVGDITDLVRARQRLIEAGALVGSSDHGMSLSLYAKDPDGLEFEIFWTVPGGAPVGTRSLDLESELARRGISAP